MSHYTGAVPDADRTPDWREAAACLGIGDAMFPGNNEAGIERAKSICARCFVQRECFRDAMRTGDNQWGIRAGLRPNERRAVAKEIRRREREKQAAQNAELAA